MNSLSETELWALIIPQSGTATNSLVKTKMKQQRTGFLTSGSIIPQNRLLWSGGEGFLLLNLGTVLFLKSISLHSE